MGPQVIWDRWGCFELGNPRISQKSLLELGIRTLSGVPKYQRVTMGPHVIWYRWGRHLGLGNPRTNALIFDAFFMSYYLGHPCRISYLFICIL